MDLDDFVGGLFTSLGGKTLIIIAVVIALIILIPGILVLWAYKLMYAFVFFVLSLVGLFVLHRLDVLDAEKHSWVIFLPLGAFAIGFLIERQNILSIQPLSVTGYEFGLSGPIILSVVLIILLAVGLASRKS